MFTEDVGDLPETVVEDNLHAAEPALTEVVVSEPVVPEVVSPKASNDVEPEPSSPSLTTTKRPLDTSPVWLRLCQFCFVWKTHGY